MENIVSEESSDDSSEAYVPFNNVPLEFPTPTMSSEMSAITYIPVTHANSGLRIREKETQFLEISIDADNYKEYELTKLMGTTQFVSIVPLEQRENPLWVKHSPDGNQLFYAQYNSDEESIELFLNQESEPFFEYDEYTPRFSYLLESYNDYEGYFAWLNNKIISVNLNYSFYDTINARYIDMNYPYIFVEDAEADDAYIYAGEEWLMQETRSNKDGDFVAYAFSYGFQTDTPQIDFCLWNVAEQKWFGLLHSPSSRRSFLEWITPTTLIYGTSRDDIFYLFQYDVLTQENELLLYSENCNYFDCIPGYIVLSNEIESVIVDTRTQAAIQQFETKGPPLTTEGFVAESKEAEIIVYDMKEFTKYTIDCGSFENADLTSISIEMVDGHWRIL